MAIEEDLKNMRGVKKEAVRNLPDKEVNTGVNSSKIEDRTLSEESFQNIYRTPYT